ncbi:MAG: C_GCAxxG_C_C family protein [Spirochaetes bacterium]|nr:C_GCAxxG_C_C family protein [Spirochaetota bacterium]
MPDSTALKKRVEELSKRRWDVDAIEARLLNLVSKGIPKKVLNREDILADRKKITDRVQRRGEEYNFLARNCAQSTALAVMEEFGLGNMEIVKALSPFPGFGGTGWMCGGVTGALIAIGLYFGSDDPLDHEAVGRTIDAARIFMPRFEATVGSVVCPKIQEEVIFGRYMDPAACPENMEAFAKDKGFEKCSLLPGIGASLAARIIIDSMV